MSLRLPLRVKKVGPVDVPLPAYQTERAAGLDLSAALDKPVRLEPGARALIPTGLALAIPDGYEGQVRPRSGLALKFGISVVNTPGTIDADYRGMVQVCLINLGQEPYVIEPRSVAPAGAGWPRAVLGRAAVTHCAARDLPGDSGRARASE